MKVLFLVVCICAGLGYSHSGRTNQMGCHNDYKTGGCR
jgi:hypothetical protein